MEDLKKIINNSLEDIYNNGTVKKMVQEQVENTIKKIIEESMNCWSEPYKKLKASLEAYMCSAIEKTDFSKHITKFSEMVDEILKSPDINTHNQVMKNLKTMFSFNNESFSKIDMSTVFDKYCKYIEDNLTIDYSDAVSTSEERAYVDCKLERNEDNYENIEWKFATYNGDEEIEEYSISLSLYKDYGDNGYRIASYGNDKDLLSIKRVNEFEMFIILLRQNYCEITNIEEMEEEVDVAIDY